ncbi:ethanolamine ammonia-lyase subunit EutC [Paludibaculum fermentans]|uniref:Ethanolamine ammonia-lyase small subunit n=1 Tax=Paludibaculum fermentans TaxID=1473598 RepID=A0A7S7NYB6_PALFE|nr:ethanolamine ammonia-lyase subunit EutC [Paludibaculum fermentans]QOY91454.1 ethanolamine ammonia-lyase subunit EutC [Paludibaculum fermentans]
MAIDLRAFTNARVALGRAGHSLPTAELLRFQLDHARARDAVHQALDPCHLPPHVLLRSAALDRATYLRRPDLGRRLSSDSAGLLAPGEYDAALIVADGLSAVAVERHARPLLAALLPKLEGWRLPPLHVVLQGRVAIGDEIGQRLGAALVVLLIGERPGLTSPDSLGIYLTWAPRAGRTDAERNCISNVRPEGLDYALAAHKLHFLMQEARARRLSGVALKEDALLL